jgi:hypothetical protein
MESVLHRASAITNTTADEALAMSIIHRGDARRQYNFQNTLVIGYIDTIGLRWDKYPPQDLVKQLRREYGRSMVGPKEVTYQRGDRRYSRGWKIEINQPTVETLLELDARAGWDPFTLYRVDLACDFTCATQNEADYLQATFDNLLVQKWRRLGAWSYEYEGTTYSGPNHKRCKIVRYKDRHSKAKATPCAHVELRLLGADACRDAGLTLDVLACGLDLRDLLTRRAKLMVVDNERTYSSLLSLVTNFQRRYRCHRKEAERRVEGLIRRAACMGGVDCPKSFDEINAGITRLQANTALACACRMASAADRMARLA